MVLSIALFSCSWLWHRVSLSSQVFSRCWCRESTPVLSLRYSWSPPRTDVCNRHRMPRRFQHIAVKIVRVTASFSGWDVFALVTWMMGEETQSLTRDIIIEQASFQLYPLCRALETTVTDNPQGGLCFEEKIDIQVSGFGCVVVCAITLPLLAHCVVTPLFRREVGHPRCVCS